MTDVHVMAAQTTIGGLQHALTPLAEACPSMHVFERPAQFLDALWLPYRRQRGEIEAAVRGAEGPVKAIFGHADVVRGERTPSHLVVLTLPCLPATHHLSPCLASAGQQRPWTSTLPNTYPGDGPLVRTTSACSAAGRVRERDLPGTRGPLARPLPGAHARLHGPLPPAAHRPGHQHPLRRLALPGCGAPSALALTCAVLQVLLV